MKRYYVAHERGKYWTVDAASLDDVRRWAFQKFRKRTRVADSLRDPLLKGRRPSGHSEIPVGFFTQGAA